MKRSAGGICLCIHRPEDQGTWGLAREDARRKCGKSYTRQTLRSSKSGSGSSRMSGAVLPLGEVWPTTNRPVRVTIAATMTWLPQLTPNTTTAQVSTTLEWIRSLSTAAAVVLAALVALFGESMKRWFWFYRPKLNLEAQVRRPDSEKVGRFMHVNGQVAAVGEAWFFRLEVSNLRNTPAREVQVYLEKIEKTDGTPVEKFTPMNLKWANQGVTTRPVLLKKLRSFCDFIHVSEPAWKPQTGENLDGVSAEKCVMCLDVEATNTGMGHLLGPGAYRFHLYVAAQNSRHVVRSLRCATTELGMQIRIPCSIKKLDSE